MRLFIGIAYFIVGIVQLFAIWDGVKYATGLGNILSFMVSMVTTYIPLLGSILGVYGAINAWGWPLWQAATLFFWYVPVFLLLYAVGMVFDR